MEKAAKPIDEVKQSLRNMQGEFQMALPPHIPAEKFMRVAVTAVQTNPDIVLKCDRQSLYAAFMIAAQDGLLPDGREAAVVPFKGKAKYMPMVAGICKKARNSGEISVLNAKSVYSKDEYESWTDEKGEHFKHVMARGDRGEYLLTYAYAITKDGGLFFEEIDATEMDKIEKVSQGNNTPWKGPFRDEMRRKSAIRRLAKHRLPSSTDLDEAVRSDDEFYDLKNVSPTTVGPGEPKRLTALIEGETQNADTVPDVTSHSESTTTSGETAVSVPNCPQCGHEMAVSKLNEDDWHCYKRGGGCGNTVPMGELE